MKINLLLFIFLLSAFQAPHLRAAETLANSAEEDLAQVQRQEAQMKANIEKLNASNPLFKAAHQAIQEQTPPPLKDAAAQIPTVNADAPFDHLAQMLDRPAIQSYLNFLTNPTLMNQVQQIIQSPHRQIVFFFEVGFFIIFLMFRAWCAVSIKNWFVGFVFRIFTNLSYGFIASVVIPWIFIGTPYIQALTTLYQSTTTLIK